MRVPRAPGPAWPFTWALLTTLMTIVPAARAVDFEDSTLGFVADELQMQRVEEGSALEWDATGFAGPAGRRLWLRSDGERREIGVSTYRTELLLEQPVLGIDGLVFGARYDTGTLPSRVYAALGLQSRADESWQWDATGYLGDGSELADVHVGVRLQGRYTWSFAPRFSLRARAEAEYWNEDHERMLDGTGSGPCELRAGVHVGYTAGPDLTWYWGAEWLRQLRDTARLTAAGGGEPKSVALTAGVRIGF